MSAVIDMQRLVPVAHIGSEQEYERAVEVLNTLLDVVRDDSTHPLYSLVSVFGDLIEAYEMNDEPLGHGGLPCL